jgi:hypothetical protein
VLPLEECIFPGGDGFSSEPPGSDLGAGTSPPKAPLQAVSEKITGPKTTRRIVDGPKLHFEFC